MSESYAIQQFRKALPQDVWFYKIPDGKTVSPTGEVTTQKKPFDVLMCINGYSIAVEFKYQKGGKTFNLDSRLEPHQRTSLLAHRKSRGYSCVILAHKPTGKRNLEWYMIEAIDGSVELDDGVSMEGVYDVLLKRVPLWMLETLDL